MSVFPAMSSQFSFENEISIVTRMDAPISKGPMARWQRKALEANSISNSSLNQSASTKLNSISCGFANLSLPLGGANSSLVAGAKRISEKTPSKTPKNSPGRNKKSGSMIPGGADRFIPSHTGTDFEASQFHLLHHDVTNAEKETMSPSKRKYKRLMAENLNGGDLENYPMVKTAELLGHTERVLHLGLSPDGTTLVSAGADETLRLWKCFVPDPTKKKQAAKGKDSTTSSLWAWIC